MSKYGLSGGPLGATCDFACDAMAADGSDEIVEVMTECARTEKVCHRGRASFRSVYALVLPFEVTQRRPF